MKNITKNIGYGVLLWLLIFVTMSIIGFTPSLAKVTNTGFELNVIGHGAFYVVLTLIIWVLTNMYFKKQKKATFKEGIDLGIIAIGTGIILDLLITIPLFVQDYKLYFSDPWLWGGFVYGILLFGVFASVERNK